MLPVSPYVRHPGLPLWMPYKEYDLPKIEIPDRSLYLAAALVNATTHTGSSGGTFACTSTTAGNCIVVACGNADGRSLSSVTDNKAGGSNTYTVDKSATATGCGAGIASTIDAGGGVTSITVNLSGSSSNLHVDVLEFSGILPTSYVGLTSNGSGASSTSLAVTSFTPTAGNVVVAAGGLSANRTWTRQSGYSWGSTDNGGSIYAQSQYILSHPGTADVCAFSLGSAANYAEVAVEYKIVTASYVPRGHPQMNTLLAM